MPWAYTELHSYSHEWHFLPGDSPRMVLLRRQRFSRACGARKMVNCQRSTFCSATTVEKIGAS